jgi:hypothetical protein
VARQTSVREALEAERRQEMIREVQAEIATQLARMSEVPKTMPPRIADLCGSFTADCGSQTRLPNENCHMPHAEYVPTLSDSPPQCQQCGEPMKLVKTVPSCGPGMPEVLAYYCSTCSYAETKQRERSA